MSGTVPGHTFSGLLPRFRDFYEKYNTSPNKPTLEKKKSKPILLWEQDNSGLESGQIGMSRLYWKAACCPPQTRAWGSQERLFLARHGGRPYLGVPLLSENTFFEKPPKINRCIVGTAQYQPLYRWNYPNINHDVYRWNTIHVSRIYALYTWAMGSFILVFRFWSLFFFGGGGGVS